MSHDPANLCGIQDSVPDSWLWVHTRRQSGKVKKERFHISVLLALSEEDAARLEDLARTCTPFVVTVQDVFLSHVERLLPTQVHCIGVTLACPALLALKDRWLDPLSAEDRRMHDPYGGRGAAGHISLAYVMSEHAAEAQQLVERLREKYLGRSGTTDRMVVESNGTQRVILLSAETSTNLQQLRKAEIAHQ